MQKPRSHCAVFFRLSPAKHGSRPVTSGTRPSAIVIPIPDPDRPRSEWTTFPYGRKSAPSLSCSSAPASSRSLKRP
ncbi:hypothetical protein BGLA2_1870004 [Burkholderia gladioli]|nr:hypothetical protein BGLA2_1870004 [Burkholderia gladioli]